MERTEAPSACQITLSPHSVERFRERVRPALSVQSARAELERLLAQMAQVRDAAPDWLAERMAQASPFYALVGDALVLPLTPAGSGWVATTCLSRGHISQPARERRNHYRRARAARKRARREGGRRGERRRIPR
jgi:hypothetical protein